MNTNQLIAHRGWQQRYPENTLIAVEQAIAAGARNIEIDIQFSADAVPVLCHDHNLQRLSGEALEIHQCTMEVLSGLSAFEPARLGQQFVGTPFCTLDECLQLIARHPEITLFIEIKHEAIGHFGRDLILGELLSIASPYQQQCVFISFDFMILAQAAARGWPRTGPILKQWQQIHELPGDNSSIEIIFCNYKKIPPELDIRTLDYPIAVYEIEQRELALALLDRGVSMIESFSIGELLNSSPDNTISN
jgi:glycerophosphoryl diester phosphodiesterase